MKGEVDGRCMASQMNFPQRVKVAVTGKCWQWDGIPSKTKWFQSAVAFMGMDVISWTLHGHFSSSEVISNHCYSAHSHSTHTVHKNTSHLKADSRQYLEKLAPSSSHSKRSSISWLCFYTCVQAAAMCCTYIRSCPFKILGSTAIFSVVSFVRSKMCLIFLFSLPISLSASFFAGESETVNHDSFAKRVAVWQDSLLWYALLFLLASL